MRSLIMLVASGAAALSTSFAASFDFNELPSGFLGETEAVLSNGQIKGGTDASDLLIFHGASSGFCFIKETFCNAGGEVFFDFDVSALQFTVSNWRSGDRARVVALDVDGIELGRMDIAFNGVVDLTSLNNVNKLVFSDTSTSNQPGVVYRNFFFEPARVDAAVPVPAGAVLMATGVLAFARRATKSAR